MESGSSGINELTDISNSETEIPGKFDYEIKKLNSYLFIITN
jgi:hypothetical protein